ncbi:Retrovirus-related Pol polyprotein from transposon TNT 1-94 [Senna tora]|uniref:Retrovirus-related Pol polyprotein from transposon TNT 1-94 n=1 Tax=Senna tora TaxID=362788 RepID=A0A834T273_9FABA|nr:Retrovirus-related Pol polyprotein from transposon TNT 1-94 [Senna tora]
MVHVSGIGSIQLSDTLTLLNVLHVPTLTYLASGKMIGNAEECNGLYLLGSSIFSNFNKVVLSVTSPPDILLWHYRLGHPNFQYMQKLTSYPTLTTDLEKSARRHETHSTPMMQTEPEDPMPSPGESEDLPIALRKG